MKRCRASKGLCLTSLCQYAGMVALASILYHGFWPSVVFGLNTPEEINTVRVYKKMSVATVLITSAYASSHHLNQDGGKGIGSGVLIDDEGLIVTNAHVVQGAAKLTVTLHDGRDLPGS